MSGSGNVAQYCIEKLLEFGAIPLTASGGGEGGGRGGREVQICARVCGRKHVGTRIRLESDSFGIGYVRIRIRVESDTSESGLVCRLERVHPRRGGHHHREAGVHHAPQKREEGQDQVRWHNCDADVAVVPGGGLLTWLAL